MQEIRESIFNKKVGVKILTASKEAGVVGSPSTYTSLGWVEGVTVRIPSLEAKYMVFCPKHKIGVPDEKLSQANIAEIPEHYRHGDIMRRLSDGSTKPSVVRHFFVPGEMCGKTITAAIEIQKKVNLINKEETLIINIHRSEKTPTRELRLGVCRIPGKEKEEISIPGSSLVVAVRKIEPVTSNSNPEKKSGVEISVACEKTIEAPVKTGVKKIVLRNGQKKFVLQR